MRRLFQALSSQTLREVEALYNSCCVGYTAAVEAGTRKHGPEAVAVDMADLDDALQWNEDAAVRASNIGRSTHAGARKPVAVR